MLCLIIGMNNTLVATHTQDLLPSIATNTDNEIRETKEQFQLTARQAKRVVVTLSLRSKSAV